MNMLATYADPAVFTASPWSVDVSGALRIGTIAGLIERAELGSAGISSIVLDDPDGTLGHSSDAILGLKQIWVDETDCPAGDQRFYTGFIADRKYRRGDSLILGVARKIDVTLADANEILTERILHLGFGADPAQPCDRPAETDFERIAWLLITGYVRAVFDLGLVASTGPVNMDACSYEGQKPADILNDCSQQSGRNHFIYYDEATATYGLFYDFNNAAVYSSSLQISNVLADVDNVTTFAPQPDDELTRDPSRVSAGMYMPFSGGTTYQELLGTAVTYAFRDAAAPSGNVTTLANADIRADRYLTENATEEDRITCTVKLPKAKVTGIKAGHRIQAKFSHLPGMTSYTWCRILTRTVKQDETTAEFYNIDLEMTPAPASISLLIAVIAGRDLGGNPGDASAHAWTRAVYTGDFSDPTQYPTASGAQELSIWWRSVVPGESATDVLHATTAGSGHYSGWVFEVLVGGVPSSTVVGNDVLNPPYNVPSLVSASAVSNSVFFGAFALQKPDYGYFSVITPTDGTMVKSVNRHNVDTPATVVGADAYTPTVWIGYQSGTGTLTIGGTLVAIDGGGWNLAGRGYGGLVIPLGGTFSLVQYGFANEFGGAGGDLFVSLPGAP